MCLTSRSLIRRKMCTWDWGLIDVVISTKPSDTGEFQEVVSVAIGARVMVTLDIDVSDGLINGVCGTVVAIEHPGNYVHTILVNFDCK